MSSTRHTGRHDTQFFHPTRIALAVLASLTGLTALPTLAQQATGQNGEVTTLDTVTVTSTRRVEPLQSVPVAVSVLKGSELEKANLNSVENIVSRVPSADFRTGSSNKDTSLFIRGIGTISTSPGVEPTVSTVIDGVVLAHPGQATLDLLDIDRIEVLRGPQGTLFGRNASAGVFNIVTLEPDRDTRRYIDLSYYEGNEKRVRAGISGELSQGVAWGSFSALYGTYDGNVTNVANGDKVNGYDKAGFRSKLVLKPNADLRISLGADYLDSTRTNNFVYAAPRTVAFPTGTATATAPALLNALSPVTPSLENRRINSDYKTYADDRNWGLSGQVDWTLGSHTLTSITAFRQWDNTQYQDGDGVPLANSHDKGTVSLEQVSQELRVTSPKGRFFDYVAGLYYQRTKDDETYQRAGNAGANQGRADYGIENTNYALFGEGSFNVTPTARLITGLRWTHTDLEFEHRRVSNQPGDVAGIRSNYSGAGSTSNDGYSGRIGPQWDISPNASAYATYSRGYKGPAYNVFFNMRALDETALKPETSDAFEIGLKTQSADKRLRANVAVFHTQYKNYQANIADVVAGTTVTRLINAGEVGTHGLELDAAYKATSRLELTGAYAYTKARVDQFLCPAGAVANCLLNGKTLPFSPDHRVTLGANYRLQLDNGKLIELGGDYRWQSKVQYQLTQTPDTVQGAYGIFNASVALSDLSQGWRVALVGKNLADKSYSPYLGQSNGALVRWVPRDDQRYFGIQFRQDF